MNALNKAIDKAGGLTKLAELVKVQPNQLSNWRTRGVPVEHCAAIEQAVGGFVTRQELRPEDWSRIWPELIDAPGAPALPATTEKVA